ncbi:MAG: hypothetical protein RL514_1499 [Verrucomicrobiota bacterium]|jgi:filamentous hemagglutinin family protein
MNTLRLNRLVRREERRFRFRPLPLGWRAMTYLALVLVLSPSLVQAADVAGAPQVVAGAAAFRQNGNVRTIEQQTGAAVINWQDFGIKAGDVTRFIQPGVNSAVLNRVLGANPSLIQGQLQANGSVYLINPNGVMVGPQGRIDVGAFFASTLNVSNEEFLKGGSLLFKGDSKAGIHNLGIINAKDGDVMLIAYTVKNAGEINAPKGVAGLAAGSEVLLTHQGDQRIVVKSGVKADGLETGVENSGVVAAAQAELKAAGGSIYELAVNQSGIVRATGVAEKNGRVLLTADGGTVKVSGEISAKNANGSGGEILVGGDYQGKNAAVANAATTLVTSTAKLDASATAATGNGGKVVVWADGVTQFKGGIIARGGGAGGDGGQVEVSGKRMLDFAGTVDASALKGRKGSLLLDPDAIVISTAANQDLIQQGGFVQALAVPSFLNNSTLSALLATTDVEIRTGDPVGGPAGYNGISVNADVNWATASKLTLVSGDTIAINANLSGGAGSGLDLQAGTRSVVDGSVGTIFLAANNSITVGSLTLGKSSLAAPGGTDVGTVNLAGTVNASTVTLSRKSGGFAGDVLINNANNTIGTVTGDGAAGSIGGNLKVRDSAGGLMVSGDLSGVAGAVEIVTGGNLTLAAGASVKNTGASDLVLAARGGSFINNAGASAVDASGSGRYLIYSDAPATTTKGGLTGATTYNKTFDANVPATITAPGDRFLYSLAPTLTFTADDKSKTYGSANPTLTFSTSGLLTGDTLGAAATGTPTISTTATAGTGAGAAAISASAGTVAATDLGYQLAYAPGTLTINKAALTVTANDASKTYGAANPAFSAAFNGLLNGDLSSVVSGLAFTTPASAGSGVGSYTVTPGSGSAANYSLTYAPGALTINKAALTITANDASKTYGAANPGFSASFSGLVNGDLSSVVGGLALGTTATTSSGVGAYPITGSGASAANYSLSYVPGALTINKAALTITANDASKTYGAVNPAFSAAFNGLVNGDLSTVVSGLAFTTPASAGSGVGSYTVTPGSGSAANYSLSYAPGALTINKAALTITANDASKTYGAVNPAFSAGFSGLVNGDLSSVVSGLAFTTPATGGSGVGSYAVTPGSGSAANYSLSYAPGALTINKAALTITANDASKTYGAANPAFSAAFNGLVNGDVSSVVSGLAFTTPATAGSGVGSYTVTPGNGSAANYSLSYAPGALTINKAPLTITANDASRLFGAADPSFTALFNGLVNGDNASVVSGLQLSTTATAASPSGAYPITPSGASAANYAIAFAPGTLSIANAILTITANDFARTYGAANPAFTASYAGFIGGDTPAVVGGLQFNTAASVSSSVGTYTITPFGATAPNYGINYVPGTLTINAADLIIRADNTSRTYGAANPMFTATFAGLVAGDTAANISGLTLTTAANAGSGVGGYGIAASGGANVNYNITRQPGTLTINKAPLTITADDLAKTYGMANPALTASYSGLVNGENASVVSGLGLNTTALTGSDVGAYPVTGSGASAANYSLTYAPGTLTINKAALTVTANDASKTYGAANPGFSAAFNGLVNGDLSTVVSGLAFTTLATAASGVGSYAVTPGSGSAANYSLTYAPGALTINKAALTITANDAGKTYGAANPAFSAAFNGLVNGDLSSVVSGLAFTTPATAGSGVGSYAVTPGSGSAANYSLAYAPGALTINKAPLTITANDASKTYGAANPAFSAAFNGLVNGDLSSVVSGLAFTTPATAGSGVGSYAVTPGSESAANYSLTYAPGALTINKAALTITANDASKTYGAANPAFTAAFNGLVNGDLSSVVSGLAFTTPATAGSGVGSYTVTPGSGNAANYSLTYAPGALTINKAALTITANDASKTYGAVNPAFSAAYSGLVNGDLSTVVSGLALGTTATTGSGVGAYPITGSGASAANYSLTYAPGALTINKAALTITADNQNKAYGSANPTLTASYSGLVNGDLSSVVNGLSLGTPAVTSSDVGRYPISGSGASAANYNITLTPGALTVNPASLTVRADNQSRTYGDANPTLSGSIFGFVLGQDASALTAAPTYSTAAGLTTSVGSYPISGSGAAAANYTFSYQPGALTINPAILSVRADNQVRVYGDANPTLTTTVSGLKNGDSADGKFSIFTLGSVAAPSSSVGNYTILLSGNDTPNDNYTAFFANGTMTVQPRPLTIRTDNISREYGLANPAFTATFTGLAAHDTAAVIPNLGFTTLATVSSPVQTLGVTPTSGNNANYAITRLPGQLTITPAPLTIGAGSHFRDYGDANPAFTPSIATGELRAGDTIASVNLRIATTASQTSPVGTYDLTAALASLNYTINNPLAGSLQILPAILDVTLGNVNRFYGEANPVNVPVSATGLKLGQSVGSVVSVGNPAAANQTVGTYSLAASSLSGNYQIRSVTGGGVQVNPRPITVSADSHARLFGDANPTFTTTLGGMGLASFDAADVLLGPVETTAFTTRESAPGLYVIRPALVANPNYQATVQTGVLTVNQRPIAITMHNLAKFYYDPNPEIAFTIGGAGLAPFHNASAVLGFLGSLPAQSANVGHYPYFPRVLDNRNYAITLTPGYLSIIPRAVEITVNSFDLAQGTAVPAFTAQFSGLPAGVSFADAFPGLTFKTSTTDTIPTVKPVPTLPVFTPPAPPAPVVVTTTTVDADGNVSVTFPIIPIQLTVPEPPPAGSFTILLPSTLSLGTETVSRQVLTVDGYNANPNYAVTKVNNGSLTIRTPRPETELQRQTRLAREGTETKLTVVGLDEHLAAQATVKLSEPLTSPKYSTLMTQAAEDYRAYLEKSGQGELLKRYFGGGIEAFLASYAGDTDRKAGMLAALSARVQSYALLPADQQPPELAEMIQSVTTRAKAFVRDEAKEAVRQHDEWVAWKADPNRVESMTVLYGDDTPDFTAKARQGRAEEALAITAGAVAVTGAAAVGIAAAVTAGGLAATYLASAATFVALGAAVVSTAFIAPVAAVVMVVVGSAVRLAQVLNEDDRVAANAQARVTAKMEHPPVDFSGPDGADLFTMSFASLMQNSGF